MLQQSSFLVGHRWDNHSMTRCCTRGVRCATLALSLLTSPGLLLGQTSGLEMPKDCLCVGIQRPACELAGRPEVVAVFLGRVSAIERLPLVGIDSVHFEVAEVFRGNVGQTTTVQVHRHRCPPFVITDEFEQGGEYVVYATESPSGDGLHLGSDAVVNVRDQSDDVFSCTSKAVRIKYGAEDLAYWRNRAHTPETGRIFGTIKEYIRQLRFDDLSEERSFEMKPLVGQEVMVQGSDHSYTTKTDEVGRYEFLCIPSGQYEVFPSGAEQNLFPARVTADVAAKGCAQVDFRKNDLDSLDSLRKKLDSRRKRKDSDR
jgi:hypothetical protein